MDTIKMAAQGTIQGNVEGLGGTVEMTMDWTIIGVPRKISM